MYKKYRVKITVDNNPAEVYKVIEVCSSTAVCAAIAEYTLKHEVECITGELHIKVKAET